MLRTSDRHFRLTDYFSAKWESAGHFALVLDMSRQFYYGEPFTIWLDDDALVLGKTYDQMKAVLAQALRLKLSPAEVVADITTGIRSMALGMVLACLDGEQDVEFVGTRYNERGQPAGELFPIIFSFEPMLD